MLWRFIQKYNFGDPSFGKMRKIVEVYLLDCATRSISLRFAIPALLISLLAAKISSLATAS